MDRRKFVELTSKSAAFLALSQYAGCGGQTFKAFPEQTGAEIFLSRGDTARNNTLAMVDALGGIERLIDKDSIVVLKPNSQWWLQGMTNTDSMQVFIDLILNMPGFAGEIIVADNHQDTKDNSRGWTTDKPNGRFNLNELVGYFNGNGHANVSKYHWHVAGSNPTPLQMRGSGNAVVTSPSEGDGYVWPDDYYESPLGTKTLLAYPIFTSSYSGTTVDLKNGAYRDRKYTGQPVRFINFSAINHHSAYAGVTASIKNYMGVVDMSCGYPAPQPKGYNNTHYNGASSTFKGLRWLAENSPHWRLRGYFRNLLDTRWSLEFKYTGGVLGAFMKHIRQADLNIITAQVIGWGSRTKPEMSVETKTILGSIDPVALDYWSAKHVLLPATKAAAPETEYVDLNDPDIVGGPFRDFLDECRRELGGTIDEDKIKVIRAG